MHDGTTNPIQFRPLVADDMRRLHHWLTTDADVGYWWREDVGSLEFVTQSYMPTVTGDEPDQMRGFIIRYTDTPIGYIQTAIYDPPPDWLQAIGVSDAVAAVDVFIGEATHRDRGIGTALMRRFLAEIVFANADIIGCMIDPEVTNLRAIRSYEKAGFRYVTTAPDPHDPECLNYMMWQTRADFFGAPSNSATATP